MGSDRPVGIVVVGFILIGSMIGIIVGAVVADRAGSRTARAELLSTAYQQAATGVAAEESLERKYRLQPGPDPLAKHNQAESAVSQAFLRILTLGIPMTGR